MEIKIGITAHHNGRFEFKICRIAAPVDGQTWVQAEKAQMSQECFNQVGRGGGKGRGLAGKLRVRLRCPRCRCPHCCRCLALRRVGEPACFDAASTGSPLPPGARVQHVMVQANVKGAQNPYDQYAYLPFKTWGGYSFDLSPPYYSFYYTVSKLEVPSKFACGQGERRGGGCSQPGG